MDLKLEKVFLNEGECISVQYCLEMSDICFSGTKPFRTPVKTDVSIENHAGTVYLKANVEFDFHTSCDRCAVDILKRFNYTFNHILKLAVDENCDENSIVIENYKLDLDKLLIDDILLETPSKFLCSDDCKGLCLNCGQNLNQGMCGCNTYQGELHFEVLKSLINENTKN